MLLWVTGPEFGVAEITVLCSELLALMQQHGYGLVLGDNANGGRMTPDARRYAAQFTRQHDIRSASASFNTSAATRLVTGLLLRALHLAGLNKSPVEFFVTEAEARTWLAAQRTRLRAQAGLPGA